MTSPIHMEVVDRAETADVEVELAAILIDAVDGGASVGFLAPLDPIDARQ